MSRIFQHRENLGTRLYSSYADVRGRSMPVLTTSYVPPWYGVSSGPIKVPMRCVSDSPTRSTVIFEALSFLRSARPCAIR